jgi:hypothetical protein
LKRGWLRSRKSSRQNASPNADVKSPSEGLRVKLECAVYSDLLNKADTAAELIRVHWMMYRDGVPSADASTAKLATVSAPVPTLPSPTDAEPGRSIDPDAPLRLALAAQIAFPRGAMTVNGLRREIGRGRLVVEEIAGKQFTTLNHIRRMRELCRVEAKDPISGSAKPAAKRAGSQRLRLGSSRTGANTSPRDALALRLKMERLRRQ